MHLPHAKILITIPTKAKSWKLKLLIIEAVEESGKQLRVTNAFTAIREGTGQEIVEIRKVVAIIRIDREEEDPSLDQGLIISFEFWVCPLDLEAEDVPIRQIEGEEMTVAVDPRGEDVVVIDKDQEVILTPNHQKSIFQDTFLKNIYSSRKESSKWMKKLLKHTPKAHSN